MNIDKLQAEYQKSLEAIDAKIQALFEEKIKLADEHSSSVQKAHQEADIERQKALDADVKEAEAKLKEAAMLENEEENKKAAKELEKKMAKELAKAKKAK